MCGRFTLRTPAKQIAQHFNLPEVPELPFRYNIAPSQDIATVRLSEEKERELAMMRWGLIPSWSKDEKIGYRMINARAETVAEKPSFRSAYKKRRCLVVADGFYEWKKLDNGKQPYFIRLREDRPFAFAGLWERWQEIESCTIITTEANEALRSIHERMPVILAPPDFEKWLGGSAGQIEAVLKPYPGDEMEAYPVSTFVNNPKNQGEECVEAVEIEA